MLARNLQAPRALQAAALQAAATPGRQLFAARFLSAASSAEGEEVLPAEVTKDEAIEEPEPVKKYVHTVPKYNPPVKTGMKGISIVRI
jgi:hypothetical protein